MKQIRNEDDKQKIVNLHESGLTHKQIGIFYKMSENGICSLLRRRGIKSHKNIFGDRNPNYKGGFLYKEGRKMIRINGKYIYEYTYIMEQHIGRKLTKGEVIHHINGNVNDNKIDNLQLMTVSEHMKLHAKQGDLIMAKTKGKSKYGFVYENSQEYNRLYNNMRYHEVKNVS